MASFPPTSEMEQRAPHVVASALRSSFDRVEKQLARFRRRPKVADSHGLRVALRRLLAAIELAHALHEDALPHKAERSFEQLLRGLSPLRDVEIVRAALDEHAVSGGVRKRLVARLERAEKKARRRLTELLRDVPYERARAAVHHACEALEAMPDDRTANVELAVRGAIARRYWEFERRRHGAAAADLHGLHRVRIAFKKYRYAVELGAPLLKPVSEEASDAMKAFQDRLGDLQDSVVVIGFLTRAHATKELVRELEADQDVMAAEIRELLETQANAVVPEFSWPLAF
jgi:CHAD domain-containing protein